MTAANVTTIQTGAPAICQQSDQLSLTGQLQSLFSHISLFTMSALSPSASTTSLESSTDSALPPVSKTSGRSEREERGSSQSRITHHTQSTVPSEPSPTKSCHDKWKSFRYALPPPTTRHHYHSWHRNQPQLLLQLRRRRGPHRAPCPDLEVYPALASLRHLKQLRPLIGSGGHELSKCDLLITKYSALDSGDDEASGASCITTGMIALLHRCNCSIGGIDQHDMVRVLDNDWIVTTVPGRHIFQTYDSSQCNVYWIARVRDGSLSRRASAPASQGGRKQNGIQPHAFDLVVKMDTGMELRVARMDPTGIRVLELSKNIAGTEEGEVPDLLTPHAASTTMNDDSTALSYLTAATDPVSVTKRITFLAIATGIWVAIQEGWLTLGTEPGKSKGKKLLDLGKGMLRKRGPTA